MKKLSIFAALSVSLFAFDFLPYGAYLSYGDATTKDKGALFGVYTSMSKSSYKLEGDAEYTEITYKDGTLIPNYKQYDLTLVGSYYYKNSYIFKAGVHNIFISQKGNSNKYDNVIFVGANYYEYLKYNFGADLYYSNYDNFDVIQFSPKVGYNFGDYYSQEGSFYAEAKLNYINITESGYTPKDNYVNIDLKLTNYKGEWSTTVFGDFGKNAYKVANDGFTVYNLGEEYKYTYGIGVEYALDKNENIKLQYSRSEFEENGADAYSNVYLLTYYRKF